MYDQEKERLVSEIESSLLKAYEAARDNVDATEDLCSVIIKKCQELRYIERDESEISRRGDFTTGSCPSMPDVGAKGER